MNRYSSVVSMRPDRASRVCASMFYGAAHMQLSQIAEPFTVAAPSSKYIPFAARLAARHREFVLADIR